MQSHTFNPKKALLQTRFIYFSLLAGMLFFLILVTTMMSRQPVLKIDFTNPLFLTLFILTCIGLPVGFFASKRYFNKMDPDAGLGNKYAIYQTGLLMRLATCDGVALLSIVCLLITNNLFSLIFLIISIAVFILYFTTPDKIGNDIQLAESEIEQFS